MNCEKIELYFARPEAGEALLPDKSCLLRAELKEGLSRPYQATVMVVSQAGLTPEQLMALPGEKVRLEITCSLNEQGEQLTRCLQAEIAQAERTSVLFAGQDGSGNTQTFVYTLQLESCLSQMDRHNHIRTFEHKTVPEVLSLVLEPYLGADFISTSLLPEDYFDREQIYMQQGESDRAFFEHLLLSYGLNYSFVHSRDGFVPTLYLSRGTVFDDGHVLYTEKGEQIKTGTLPCTLTPQSSEDSMYLRRFSFSFKQKPVSVAATDSEAGCKTFALPSLSRRHFGAVPVQREQVRLQQNLTDRAHSAQSKISALTDDIQVQAGMVLSVPGFAGSTDNSALLLTARQVRLTACASFPEDLAIPPAAGISKQLQVKLKLLYVPEGCSSPGSLVKPVSPACAAAGVANLAGEGSVRMFRATVCCADGTCYQDDASAEGGRLDMTGKVCPAAGDDGENPVQFYAHIAGADGAVVASNTLPQGGSVANLFAFPRVGDEVMLLACSHRFYLSGYMNSQVLTLSEEQQSKVQGLPAAEGTDSPALAFDENLQRQALNSSLWEYKPAEGDLAQIGLLQFDKTANQAAFEVYHGGMDLLVERLVAEQNDSSIRTTYNKNYKSQSVAALNKVKQAKATWVKDNAAWQEAQLTADKAITEEEKKSAQEKADNLKKQCEQDKTSFNTACTDFYTLMGKMATDLKMDKVSAAAHVSMLSRKGDITASAPQGIMDLRSRAMTLSSDGTLTLNADKIVLTGNHGVNMAVGGNVVSLSRNGIVLESQKWTQAPGIMDAFIYMDCITGISMGGMSMSMSGVLSASMSDSFGGNVAVSNGSLNASGNKFSLSTTSRKDAIENLITFTAGLANEIVDLGLTLGLEDSELSGKITSQISYAIPDADKFYGACYNIYDTVKDLNPQTIDAMAVVNAVLKLIIALIDATQHSMMCWAPQILDSPAGGSDKISVRDCIRLSTLALKGTLTVTALTATLPLSKGASASSISAKTDTITFETKKMVQKSGETSRFFGPLAGTTLSGADKAKYEEDKAKDKEAEHKQAADEARAQTDRLNEELDHANLSAQQKQQEADDAQAQHQAKVQEAADAQQQAENLSREAADARREQEAAQNALNDARSSGASEDELAARQHDYDQAKTRADEKEQAAQRARDTAQEKTQAAADSAREAADKNSQAFKEQQRVADLTDKKQKSEEAEQRHRAKEQQAKAQQELQEHDKKAKEQAAQPQQPEAQPPHDAQPQQPAAPDNPAPANVPEDHANHDADGGHEGHGGGNGGHEGHDGGNGGNAGDNGNGGPEAVRPQP